MSAKAVTSRGTQKKLKIKNFFGVSLDDSQEGLLTNYSIFKVLRTLQFLAE